MAPDLNLPRLNWVGNVQRCNACLIALWMTGEPVQDCPVTGCGEPPWPTDRCAECDATEGLHNPCPDKHPPLCEDCVELWYPRNLPEDDVDCRSLPV